MKLLAVTLALGSALIWAKSRTVYCPPEFWTRMRVFNCKETSPNTMRCMVDVTTVGYSLKPPANPTSEFPKAKIEVQH